jgi:hypothetical protein
MTETLNISLRDIRKEMESKICQLTPADDYSQVCKKLKFHNLAKNQLSLPNLYIGSTTLDVVYKEKNTPVQRLKTSTLYMLP